MFDVSENVFLEQEGCEQQRLLRIAALQYIGAPHETGIVLCGVCSPLLVIKHKKEPLTDEM
jgi:hypothetical protein